MHAPSVRRRIITANLLKISVLSLISLYYIMDRFDFLFHTRLASIQYSELASMLLAPCLILQFLLQLCVIHSIILLLLVLVLLGDLAAFDDLLGLAQLQDMRFITSVSLSCSSIGWSLAS